MLDVVGIGSMMVDRVHRPVRLLGRDEKGIMRDLDAGGPVRRYVGGVVLNHIGWAAALGLRTGIFGRQADDEGGRFLRAAMARLGIETHIAIEGSASSLAEIFVDDEGERAIYMAPGATADTTAAHIRERHADFIVTAARLSTEVSQLPLDATLEALRLARDAGLETVVDLDIPPRDALATLGDAATLERVLRGADLLKPSKSAAAELVPAAGGDALAIARAMRERYGNRSVVITDGEAGCAICAEGFEGEVAARRVAAVDTTGAGDAFLGGLLVALSHEIPWQDVGRFANACGAACVQQTGAFPEDPQLARSRVLELYDGVPFELSPMAGGTATPCGVERSSGAEPGLRALRVAAAEIGELARRHDGNDLLAAAELVEAAISRRGRVHVTGVGKAEHVARYGASLLSSTGIPAAFLHATEVLHGSLGQIAPGDVVIAVSNSGETSEVLRCVEAVVDFGARLLALTGAGRSRLAERAAVVIDASVAREGGPLDLAPRASVAAEILVLGALSALLQDRAGFTRADYAERHPAGELGKRARDEY